MSETVTPSLPAVPGLAAALRVRQAAQRDVPLLQGAILVLAMFFVALNLIVDVVQTALDPRIERG